MHSFQCPHCAGVFQILPNSAAQAVACPHCNGGVLIPEMSGAVSAPPVTAEPPPPPIAAHPPDLTQPAMALPSSVFPSGPSVSSASPFEPRRREFAIPTPDGGQQTIREPVKMVSSGAKTRQLRDLSSAEKSARRGMKNTIVFAVCGAILAGLMWWLLQ